MTRWKRAIFEIVGFTLFTMFLSGLAAFLAINIYGGFRTLWRWLT